MLELIIATSILVGSVEISPGIYQEQYLANVNGESVLVEIETDLD